MNIIAGAIGVLAGVERLMSRPQPRPHAKLRVDYFEIKRTKSDLGYTYWVLHGFGRYSCFALFDTWREAMDEALLRIKTAAAQPEIQPVGTSTAVRFRPRASQNVSTREPAAVRIS